METPLGNWPILLSRFELWLKNVDEWRGEITSPWSTLQTSNKVLTLLVFQRLGSVKQVESYLQPIYGDTFRTPLAKDST